MKISEINALRNYCQNYYAHLETDDWGSEVEKALREAAAIGREYGYEYSALIMSIISNCQSALPPLVRSARSLREDPEIGPMIMSWWESLIIQL